MNTDIFDKRQTFIAKGIAVILLLWHHLFFYIKNVSFISVFTINDIAIESIIAAFFRVCVAMFLFLSGYGMYKSWIGYNKRMNHGEDNNKSTVYIQLLFIKTHIMKLLFDFWFIFIIFVFPSIWWGKPFWEVYNYNIGYGMIDFLGVSDLFGTPTMNGSWWFMSLIIILYMAFPILALGMKKKPEIMLLIGLGLILLLLLTTTQFFKYNEYYLPFICGMYFARRELFSVISKKCNTTFKRLVLVFPTILICLLFRAAFHNKTYLDSLFSIAIIMFSYFFVSKIKYLSGLFEAFGKLSGDIYMFHLFVNYNYLQGFIFSFKFSLLIFLIYVIICFAIAKLLYYIKEVTRYKKLCSLIR